MAFLNWWPTTLPKEPPSMFFDKVRLRLFKPITRLTKDACVVRRKPKPAVLSNAHRLSRILSLIKQFDAAGRNKTTRLRSLICFNRINRWLMHRNAFKWFGCERPSHLCVTFSTSWPCLRLRTMHLLVSDAAIRCQNNVQSLRIRRSLIKRHSTMGYVRFIFDLLLRRSERGRMCRELFAFIKLFASVMAIFKINKRCLDCAVNLDWKTEWGRSILWELFIFKNYGYFWTRTQQNRLSQYREGNLKNIGIEFMFIVFYKIQLNQIICCLQINYSTFIFEIGARD